MNQFSENEKLNLLKSLFKGREDVFAIHWEKGSKSGYMPAYKYDPYMYRLHQMKGGTFKDYSEKSYRPLIDPEFIKHLNGEHLMGVYPLLSDNTSWFIAADFDKVNWAEECRVFINRCTEQGIPAYLERSRSGNGGHVWIFFEKPYPSIKSRRILTHLLEEAGIFSLFDKNSSFDRLFPNQDFLSGKGLGNLIAMPFYKPALQAGNSCFVDENLTPYNNQWEFLASVKRVSATHLDTVYNSISSTPVSTVISHGTRTNKLQIKLENAVRLNRLGLVPSLISFLKEELNFVNSEYIIKKNTGRHTWNMERYFKCMEETEDELIIPRGFIGKLIRYCNKENIEYEFLDERKKREPVLFNANLNLRSYQESAITVTTRKEFGVIAAPPGSGKTVIGLKIIAEKQQPALIIVHRNLLLDQWIERIQAFLGITKQEIGVIGQGRARIGKRVTIAMIQSLGKHIEQDMNSEFAQAFGTIIVDECHHIPAETFRSTLSKLSPYYQYGLTATPFRKGNDDKLIFIHLGEIVAEIKAHDIEKYKRSRVIIRETELEVPFNSKTDPFEILSKILVHDSSRNKLVLADITRELNGGKRVVIITERKEHIDTLYQFLKQSFEVVTLSGEDSEGSRKSKWHILNSGNYQALITTGQFFGEGTDLQNASCLFLVYPFSFKGKLIQYIGRVQRSEITPVIYDYRDRKINYLDRLFLKRNTYYRHLDKQASLFDEPDIVDTPSKQTLTIEKKVRVPIDQLDFRYGAIAFYFHVSDKGVKLEFEIENDEVRPEFDVLKPYFSKVLKTNYVEADIFAEFEKDQLVSQKATSRDLERINREIIDSVKFYFIEHGIINRKYVSGNEENILDVNQVQEGMDGTSFYNSDEEMMNDLLKNENVKHYKQLRYLASKHDGSVLKLRFVLDPFSFVFLLPGTEQYHVVLETLDTEEATYIWHIDIDLFSLPRELKTIDQDINAIRGMGRKAFFEKRPENFTRIIHDYSEERKGFVVWKDRLEETLT